VLAGLATSRATPTAIELLAGPHWMSDAIVGEVIGRDATHACAVVVALEGTELEVKWMIDELGRQWQTAGVEHYAAVVDSDAAALWQKLTEFSQSGPSPLVLKASLVASGVTRFASAVREIDPRASLQCHAGNGIVIARFAEFPAGGLSRTLIQNSHPSPPKRRDMCQCFQIPKALRRPASARGGGEAPFALMSEVKKQFDPRKHFEPRSVRVLVSGDSNRREPNALSQFAAA
jgi:hypothetical protein